ncbi:hypothetical protein [Sciscionella marina]|uniref:hypothetical protein n=1 Tax=Sciscionella marina TaxID=508770 RepID=UPI00036E67E4|nr:hypothetical protein [Sciscionella marina]
MIGVVFRDNVTNSGIGVIGWIMLGTSVVLLLLAPIDRRLPRTAATGVAAGKRDRSKQLRELRDKPHRDSFGSDDVFGSPSRGGSR